MILKKLIVVVLLVTSVVSAANIISYQNDEKTEFVVYHSAKITQVYYDEEDSEFVIRFPWGNGMMTRSFIVETEVEAKNISQKIFNVNDTAMIELIEM